MSQKPSASKIDFFLSSYGKPAEVKVDETEIVDDKGAHVAMMFTFADGEEVCICCLEPTEDKENL